MKVGMIALMAAFLMLAAPAWAGPSDPCAGEDDVDSDTVCDAIDNCQTIPNAAPFGCDTDSDGYGNVCDGDYDQGGTVAGPDFALFVPDFIGGADSGIGTDMDCGGTVAGPDFPAFIAQFTVGSPGPSGLKCAGTAGCGAKAGN